MGETRIIDPVTGGMKGSKTARFDMIPAKALWALAEHYGKGEAKYPSRNGVANWRRSYKYSLSFAAMMRHAWAWWGGEDDDPETGDSHLVAVMWHAAALFTFMDEHPEMDDRFKSDDRLNSSVSAGGDASDADTVKPPTRAKAD